MAFLSSIGHIAFAFALFALLVVTLQAIRIERLERKLDLILRGLKIDVADQLKLSERVRELAADPGKKLEAIRTYREETGCDLAEAKDAVEIYLSSLKT